MTFTHLLSLKPLCPFVCPSPPQAPSPKGQESRRRSDVSLSWLPSFLLIRSKSPVTYKAVCLRHCGDSACSFVSFCLGLEQRVENLFPFMGNFRFYSILWGPNEIIKHIYQTNIYCDDETASLLHVVWCQMVVMMLLLTAGFPGLGQSVGCRLSCISAGFTVNSVVILSVRFVMFVSVSWNLSLSVRSSFVHSTAYSDVTDFCPCL